MDAHHSQYTIVGRECKDILTRDEEIADSIKDDLMLSINRRGKSHDPEFVKWLYEKYYGELDEGNRTIKRKRKRRTIKR